MRLFVSLLFLLYAPELVVAQDNIQVNAYGVDDGLPQSSVWDIAQDRNGFLWVGTSDGLCRFDGYSFAVYKNNQSDSSSICGNRNHVFYVDKTGNLWIACWNGISLYNEQKDNFTTLFTYDPPISTDNFNAIFGEDDRYIWAGFSNCGLIRIDKRTRKVNAIRTAGNIDLSAVRSWSSGFVEDGKIWLCTGGILLVYDIARGTLSSIGANHLFTSVMSLNDSELVAGGDRCLEVCNKKKLTTRNLPVELGNTGPELISTIAMDTNEVVIFGCHKGLFYCNTRSGKVIKSITSFDTQQQNKYAFAKCLYRDKARNLWVGTNGDGLKKINYPYKKFLLYNSHSEVSNLVKCIYADSERVYVGYFNNGMDIFSRKKGFEKNLSAINNYNKTNHVYAVTYLGAGLLVADCATYNYICTINPSSGEVISLLPLLRKIIPGYSEVTNNYPFLVRARNGRIYCSAGECLTSLNEPQGTKIHPSLVHRFANESLCCCYEDDHDRLWVGTMNCVYSCNNGEWNKVGLPENVQVKCLCNDADGNLWVGTVKGIYVLGSNGQVIGYFSEANGLANQFVYGILRDDDGNMWFSHNKGLSVYYARNKKFRHYYKEDGLQSSEFNTNSYYKTSDGMLFFGGINGVNGFNPREILDNPHVPNLKITSIKLFEEPLKTDSAYWSIHSLVLPYDQNSLSFEFAAMEFSNPQKNQYAYFMEGLDKAWIKAGDKRFARYAGLQPGEYVFKVKASNNDGVWQQLPTVVYITIVPPYWQRWWFRILMVFAGIATTAGVIVQIQRARNKRRTRALELQQKIQQERERISRDLHDNVGTQLSLISNNIEWVTHPVKSISNEEKEEKLQFVNDSARDIISTLRETIWALKKEKISLEEFADKLKAFVQKQLAFYPGIQLTLEEEIEGAIVLGPSEALNLFRICQEALANTLKYAEAPAIEIRITGAAGKYAIDISDNGRGFDPGSVNASVQNGLENMSYRATDIDCQLEIFTSAGKGTRITLRKK